jgi:hypothetical protein
MSDAEEREVQIANVMQITRMVGYSMFLGVAVFYVLILFLLNQPGAGQRPVPIAAAIGVVLSLLLVALSYVAKALLFGREKLRTQSPKPALPALLRSYRFGSLAGMGLSEAGAFVMAVCVLLAGPSYRLWLAAGAVSVAAMVLHLPSRDKLDGYLAEADQAPSG